MTRSKAARKPKGETDNQSPETQLIVADEDGQTETELRVVQNELRIKNRELEELSRALAGASARLDADRRRLQDLFDLAPDGYLVTDRYGAIIEANRAALQLLNWPPAMLFKSPLPMFVTLADRPAFRKKLAELTKSPLIQSLEVHIK